ncbi:MAG: hypothetical protein PVG41_02310 [Desulfobacteraceae bacterium]
MANIIQIEKMIADVENFVASITAAVEEPSAATKKIAGGFGKSAHGIQDLNENVAQCSKVSGQ